MFTKLGPQALHRFDRAIQYEWLETNGLGGFANSTVIGTNTRSYHGLLVAAMHPPVDRQLLLSKLDETLVVDGRRYELGTNKYQGAIYPNGYIFLKEFEKNVFPQWNYEVAGHRIRKTIGMIHGENTVVIGYEVLDGPQAVELELLPLINGRDHHGLTTRGDFMMPEAAMQADGSLFTRLNQDRTGIFMSLPGGTFGGSADWYYRFEYPAELERGQSGYEDSYAPGRWHIKMQPGSRIAIIASTDPIHDRDGWELLDAERRRRMELMDASGMDHPLTRELALNADQFIVQRGDHQKTILAGYPWFTDWGRDTMISLPGLCMSVGRDADARTILDTFISHTDAGMMPNRFPDANEPALYNTVDGTLWFFVAAYHYYQQSGDSVFARDRIMPAMQEILDWHQNGTRFGIHEDADGLLTAGEEGVQLTWMDAKVGDWVVTPRRGKAVEINALWYNAWEIFAWFNHRLGFEEKGYELEKKAQEVKQAFGDAFWFESGGYLFDYLLDNTRDTAIRPNQIFALSLPFPAVDARQASLILQVVEEHLLTPVGLRSLSPEDESYLGRYEGDIFARDAAYHQGTVWAWLIGPYIDALIRVKGNWGKKRAAELVLEFGKHLHEAGIGSVSEIFDGNSPHTPRGCYAQAWSIAELLRVCQTYKLLTPEKEDTGTRASIRSSLKARLRELAKMTEVQTMFLL